MEKCSLTRRTLMKRTPAVLAGLFLLGGSMVSSASTKDRTTGTSGPPGSCRKWTDKRGDGCCDESRSCRRTRCPAHEDNPKRKKSAPNGTCALWKDPDETGTCEVSLREERACPCTSCPSNCHCDSDD